MNQRFFAEFLALLAKNATESDGSNHNQKRPAIKPDQSDDEDPLGYAIEDSLEAEERKTKKVNIKI